MGSYQIELRITAPDGTVYEASEPVSKRVVEHSPRGSKKALDEAIVLMSADVVNDVVSKIGLTS